jgi:PAS domain S-box-containing protein
MQRGHQAAPDRTPLGVDAPWPIEQALKSNQASVIDIDRLFDDLPKGDWERPPSKAALVPIQAAGQTGRSGVLIVGLNPFRLFDEKYSGFLSLVARQIAASVSKAEAFEEERKRAEALAEIDRAKTAFFSNVSHEFRTPLTLMLGPIEDLLRGEFGPLTADQRRQAEVLHRNALRLLKLVNTLLDFSRIEAGRVQAVYEPTDLPTLTADLASAFRSAIERAGMAFIVETPPLHEPIYVDHSMWEKIVLNLLSNAFKFTFAGEIQLRLESHADHVVLIVQDTGIGIPGNELPRLFERFHRVEGAAGRSHEGSGIGLALVQELVKLHGGTIAVTSEPGRGTRFTISIPKGMAHLPSDRISAKTTLTSTAISTHAYVEEATRWLPDAAETILPENDLAPMTIGGLQAAAYSGSRGEKRRARVVLADDNADMREYVRRLLAGRYEVDAHPDGESALEAIRAQPPDLILTDVMMPRLDGFGLLREVRRDSVLQGIPVIMLSARSGEESRIEGMEAGADDYLVKPFSARELLARVAAHLEMSRIRLEAAKRERELLEATEAAKMSLERILTSLKDRFCTFDREWRFTYLNEGVAEDAGRPPAEILGKFLWEVFPGTKESLFGQELRRAVREDRPVQFDFFYPGSGRWFENRVYPYPEGFSLFATEITERKRAEEQLKELLAREQAAVRYRDEFLGIASHELRTPLSSLKLQLQLTQRAAARLGSMTALPPERLNKMVDVFSRQIGNLSTLVEDLLDVSRIANGRLTIEPQETDAVALVKDVMEQMREQLDAARCEVLLDAPPSFAGCWWDSRRIEQVFVNLLSNAAKYAAGKPVQITLFEEAGHVTITVKDEGIGVAPEAQQRIFDRFERAIGSSNISGLGLGLYITREIVEAHGGHIRVESELGRGSTFIVEMPRKALRTIEQASA